MPIRTPARRLNPEKYKVAKELFDEMLKLGIMAVGGALEQRGDQGKWEPLAFFSRKLDAFMVRWNLLTAPLACGWYDVV
jgi:hypothetical protein